MLYNPITNQNTVENNIVDHIHATEATVETEIEALHVTQDIIIITNTKIVVIQDPNLDPHLAEIVIIHIIIIISPIHIIEIAVIADIPTDLEPVIEAIIVDQRI